MWTDVFPKKTHRWPTGTQKDVQHHKSSERCISKPQWGITSHRTECAVLCLVAQLSLTLCDLMDCSPPCPFVHGDFPGKNTGVGFQALLQGIFPPQGSKPGLQHCRWILYHLSQQGSPRILERVAYPFSNGTSQPRNRTGVLLHCRWIPYQLSYLGSHLSGWFSSIPQIIHVGKDVEKGNPCALSRNVNWYIHCWEKYGGFSKN